MINQNSLVSKNWIVSINLNEFLTLVLSLFDYKCKICLNVYNVAMYTFILCMMNYGKLPFADILFFNKVFKKAGISLDSRIN